MEKKKIVKDREDRAIKEKVKEDCEKKGERGKQTHRVIYQYISAR